MTAFARPEEDDIVAVAGGAIEAMRAGRIRTDRFHEQVRMVYSWTDVAARTERVYEGIMGDLSEDEFYGRVDDPLVGGDGDVQQQRWSGVRGRTGAANFALIDRLKRYYGCGVWAGKLFCICVVVDYLLFVLLEFVFPRSRIDLVRDWPRKHEVVDADGPSPRRHGHRREEVG
jgi:phosphatidylinositol glycan class A protein